MIFLTDALQRLVGLFNIRSLEAGKFQEAVKIHLLQIVIMASDGDDGKEYISVVLKSANRPSLYDNMTEILTKISNK